MVGSSSGEHGKVSHVLCWLQEWLPVMLTSAEVLENLMAGAGGQGPSRQRFDLVTRVNNTMAQMSMFTNNTNASQSLVRPRLSKLPGP